MDEMGPQEDGREQKSATLLAIERCEEGVRLHNLKHYHEALAAFEQAIRLDPSLARPYGGKGIVLLVGRRYEEALQAFDQALERDPGAARYYIGKANVLGKLKRYQEAVEAYEKARQLEPQNELLPKAIAQLKRLRRQRLVYRVSMGLWRSYYAVVILGAGFTMAILSLQINVWLAPVLVLLTIGATIILFWKTYR